MRGTLEQSGSIAFLIASIKQSGATVAASPRKNSKLQFLFELRPALDAVITGQSGNQLQTHPLIENSAYIFARNARHGRDVALAQLLPNDDTTTADLVAESFGKVKQCSRDPAFDRQERSRRNNLIGIAQARGKHIEKMLVEFRIFLGDRLERRATDEAELAIAKRGNRCRPRAAIDHRHITDDRTGPQYSEDAFGTSGRDHANYKQACVQTVAAATRITGKKQDLVGRQFDRLGIGENTCGQSFRQIRKQIGWRRGSHSTPNAE
jgi:hypothetical protein